MPGRSIGNAVAKVLYKQNIKTLRRLNFFGPPSAASASNRDWNGSIPETKSPHRTDTAYPLKVSKRTRVYDLCRGVIRVHVSGYFTFVHVHCCICVRYLSRISKGKKNRVTRNGNRSSQPVSAFWNCFGKHCNRLYVNNVDRRIDNDRWSSIVCVSPYRDTYNSFAIATLLSSSVLSVSSFIDYRSSGFSFSFRDN